MMQILFFIIRQEQVRHWTECESQEEGWKRPLTKERNDESGKSVQWLQGRHGEVWVWVMGDSPGDKPYAMIVKELMEERARRQAQLEAQELWRKKEEEIKQKFRDAITKEKDRKAAKQEEEGMQEKLKVIDQQTPQTSKSAYVDPKQLMTRKARWARDEYKRQSLQAIEKSHVAALFFPISPAWVRTPRPSSREMLILWFTEEEKPKQAGYERNGNDIAPWFHGIISRDDSETLLMNAAEGSFLVWVSEMIWSYTLSYRTASIFKHFLINVSRDCYGFLVLDQNRHATLEEVITTTRKELLLEACKRTGPSVDFRGISHDSSHAKDFKDGSLQGS
uniref:SH2 domain containing 4Ba n=1 Tax=Cyprinus carpio TaxID=7962 RepID=A0A8C2FJR4_CYPCA